ncbi:hypothetical protein ACFWJ4_13920 [Kitasatospora sp. NPDC127067]|uniref:hypothetical protein n=1 Tax=Kitasatospora sp. NPDC127067 TaxID=3347126 RepID=UPI003662FE97
MRRLQITRETLLEIAGDDDRTPGLVPSAYRQILALFENAEDGLRAKDVCRALGVGAEPRHTEGTRAKLKRLVSRGVLIEPEPGLFTIPQPSRTTTVPPSS